MTEAHSLGEWEANFDETFEDMFFRRAMTSEDDSGPVKDFIRSLLLAQKEGFRREIEGMKQTCTYHDEYTAGCKQCLLVRGANAIVNDLLTKLDTNLI